MEKWRSNESSIQFFTTLNMAAPVPHHMLYRRRVGRERARKSYLARPSSLFRAAPRAIYRRNPQPNWKCAVSEATRGKGGKKDRTESTLAETPPSCFPPSKKQQMQTARMKYKILEAFIQNHHVIAEREQHNRNRCRSAGKRRRRTTRSFGDRPPGVGNSYCDTTGGRPGGPRDSRNSQPESPGPE